MHAYEGWCYVGERSVIYRQNVTDVERTVDCNDSGFEHLLHIGDLAGDLQSSADHFPGLDMARLCG